MLKFLRCLFIGHYWELLSNKSFPRVLSTAKGELDEDMKRGLLGYKEWVKKCNKCSKIIIEQTIGE